MHTVETGLVVCLMTKMAATPYGFLLFYSYFPNMDCNIQIQIIQNTLQPYAPKETTLHLLFDL